VDDKTKDAGDAVTITITGQAGRSCKGSTTIRVIDPRKDKGRKSGAGFTHWPWGRIPWPFFWW